MDGVVSRLVAAEFLGAFDLSSLSPEHQIFPLFQSLSDVSLLLVLQSVKTPSEFPLFLWPLAE